MGGQTSDGIASGGGGQTSDVIASAGGGQTSDGTASGGGGQTNDGTVSAGGEVIGLQVFVTIPSGEKLSIDVEADATVLDILTKIPPQHIPCIPALSYQDHELEVDKPLADVGVGAEAGLYLIRVKPTFVRPKYGRHSFLLFNGDQTLVEATDQAYVHINQQFTLMPKLGFFMGEVSKVVPFKAAEFCFEVLKSNPHEITYFGIGLSQADRILYEEEIAVSVGDIIILKLQAAVGGVIYQSNARPIVFLRDRELGLDEIYEIYIAMRKNQIFKIY